MKMTKLELTSEQKHDISVELNASDIYETVPFLNKILAAIGYIDRLEDDSEREELRWTKRKEPLIKDEKIRKAVRAWAEAESIPPEVTIYYNADEYSLGWHHTVLEFSKHIKGLRDESEYTIAELCGEEEA